MIRLVENRKDRDGNTLTMVDQFLFRQIEATLGIREAVCIGRNGTDANLNVEECYLPPTCEMADQTITIPFEVLAAYVFYIMMEKEKSAASRRFSSINMKQSNAEMTSKFNKISEHEDNIRAIQKASDILAQQCEWGK